MENVEAPSSADTSLKENIAAITNAFTTLKFEKEDLPLDPARVARELAGLTQKLKEALTEMLQTIENWIIDDDDQETEPAAVFFCRNLASLRPYIVQFFEDIETMNEKLPKMLKLAWTNNNYVTYLFVTTNAKHCLMQRSEELRVALDYYLDTENFREYAGDTVRELFAQNSFFRNNPDACLAYLVRSQRRFQGYHSLDSYNTLLEQSDAFSADYQAETTAPLDDDEAEKEEKKKKKPSSRRRKRTLDTEAEDPVETSPRSAKRQRGDLQDVEPLSGFEKRGAGKAPAGSDNIALDPGSAATVSSEKDPSTISASMVFVALNEDDISATEWTLNIVLDAMMGEAHRTLSEYWFFESFRKWYEGLWKKEVFRDARNTDVESQRLIDFVKSTYLDKRYIARTRRLIDAAERQKLASDFIGKLFTTVTQLVTAKNHRMKQDNTAEDAQIPLFKADFDPLEYAPLAVSFLRVADVSNPYLRYLLDAYEMNIWKIAGGLYDGVLSQPGAMDVFFPSSPTSSLRPRTPREIQISEGTTLDPRLEKFFAQPEFDRNGDYVFLNTSATHRSIDDKGMPVVVTPYEKLTEDTEAILDLANQPGVRPTLDFLLDQPETKELAFPVNPLNPDGGKIPLKVNNSLTCHGVYVAFKSFAKYNLLRSIPLFLGETVSSWRRYYFASDGVNMALLYNAMSASKETAEKLKNSPFQFLKDLVPTSKEAALGQTRAAIGCATTVLISICYQQALRMSMALAGVAVGVVADVTAEVVAPRRDSQTWVDRMYERWNMVMEGGKLGRALMRVTKSLFDRAGKRSPFSSERHVFMLDSGVKSVFSALFKGEDRKLRRLGNDFVALARYYARHPFQLGVAAYYNVNRSNAEFATTKAFEAYDMFLKPLLVSIATGARQTLEEFLRRRVSDVGAEAEFNVTTAGFTEFAKKRGFVNPLALFTTKVADFFMSENFPVVTTLGVMLAIAGTIGITVTYKTSKGGGITAMNATIGILSGLTLTGGVLMVGINNSGLISDTFVVTGVIIAAIIATAAAAYATVQAGKVLVKYTPFGLADYAFFANASLATYGFLKAVWKSGVLADTLVWGILQGLFGQPALSSRTFAAQIDELLAANPISSTPEVEELL